MKKILSCILAGAMMISLIGATSVFAAEPETGDVQTKTVVATESDGNKCKEANTDTESRQPASKSFWNNEALVEGVKGAAAITIVGSGLSAIAAVASTLVDFPLMPVVAGIAAITGISASVVCLGGVAIAITGANPFNLLMNIATADYAVSFVHHTLRVIKLVQDIYTGSKG